MRSETTATLSSCLREFAPSHGRGPFIRLSRRALQHAARGEFGACERMPRLPACSPGTRVPHRGWVKATGHQQPSVLEDKVGRSSCRTYSADGPSAIPSAGAATGGEERAAHMIGQPSGAATELTERLGVLGPACRAHEMHTAAQSMEIMRTILSSAHGEANLAGLWWLTIWSERKASGVSEVRREYGRSAGTKPATGRAVGAVRDGRCGHLDGIVSRDTCGIPLRLIEYGY